MMNIPGKLAVVIVALGSVSVAQAELIEGSIDDSSQIDYYFFTSIGGEAVFNVLAGTGTVVETYGNWLDSMIVLAVDDGSSIGSLTGALLAANDDCDMQFPFSSGRFTCDAEAFSDGSIVVQDSFLRINLPAGNYVLGIGSVILSGVDFRAGTNTWDWDSWYREDAYDGSYRLTYSGGTSVPEPVTIDIKPGSDPACNGAIPVAILGSDTLDVTQIDPSTLAFEGLEIREKGNGALSCGIEDVNFDGYDDFSCRYQNGITEGTVTGELLDGTPIEGTDIFCVAH